MIFKCSASPAIVLTLAIVLCPVIAKATVLENTIARITACGNESKSVARLLAAALDKRIKNDEAEEILEPILDICEQGYPVKMYFQKLDEGLGKKIPAPLIIAAIKKMHDNFMAIRTVASSETVALEKNLVERATAAANAGVQVDFVTTCITKYNGNPDPEVLTTALLIAQELAETGFDQSQIAKIVSAGLENGSIDTSWKYVSRVISASRAKGIADSELTTTATRILKKNGTIADFMVALGFSERNIK